MMYQREVLVPNTMLRLRRSQVLTANRYWKRALTTADYHSHDQVVSGVSNSSSLQEEEVNSSIVARIFSSYMTETVNLEYSIHVARTHPSPNPYRQKMLRQRTGSTEYLATHPARYEVEYGHTASNRTGRHRRHNKDILEQPMKPKPILYSPRLYLTQSSHLNIQPSRHQEPPHPYHRTPQPILRSPPKHDQPSPTPAISELTAYLVD